MLKNSSDVNASVVSSNEADSFIDNAEKSKNRISSSRPKSIVEKVDSVR